MPMSSGFILWLGFMLLCRDALAQLPVPSPLPCDAYGFTCPLYTGVCPTASFGNGPFPLWDEISSTTTSPTFTCYYELGPGVAVFCEYNSMSGANYANGYGTCCPSAATCPSARRRGLPRKEIVLPVPDIIYPDVLDDPEDPHHIEDKFQPW